MSRAKGGKEPEQPKCSFCGKSENMVGRLVAREEGGARICDECLSVFNETLYEEKNGPGQWGRLARDLTKAAREGELSPVLGLEREVERVMQVLSRYEGHIPLIIGQQGVGKTSVVYGLAHRIVRVEVPQGLARKRVYRIDRTAIAQAAASPSVREQWTEQIASEGGDAREAILFFDDLHAAAELAMVRQLLAPKGAQVIGAMTSAEYGRIRYPELARVVTLVPVAEPTIAETAGILDSFRERLQNHHRVTIDAALLPAIVEASARKITARRLPARAIDLLDEAASLASIRRRSEVDLGLVSEAVAAHQPPSGIG